MLKMTGACLRAAAIAAALCVLLCGCRQQPDSSGRLRVVMVPKFTGFVFFELAREGAAKACEDLDADFTYIGTTTADIEGQVQVLQNLVAQRPGCVITAALDTNAPVPVLKRMRRNETVVVTFDADVAPAGRDLFINMAPFQTQARAMLESALANNPAGGDVIWLAPHATTANFIAQKRAIDALVQSDPRYGVFRFVDTLYMEDDPEKSYQAAVSAMQAHPGLAGFITGSGPANPAVNKAIQDTGRAQRVFATGFALPSTMKTYLDNGVCRQFALWDPFLFGYMAAHTAIQIKRGGLQVREGARFVVPDVGERVIHLNESGVLTADLNRMLFFTKGHDDFVSAIPMAE